MAAQDSRAEAMDRRVRMYVIGTAAETGAVPGVEQIADALGQPRSTVEDALRSLAAGRVLVLAPGGMDIWMAHPFSAVPTAFRVYARGCGYYGNCIWDAMGIAAILRVDARIETRCGDCGSEMSLQVRDGALVGGEGIVHFAVPAARWWDDIGYT